MTEYGDNVRLVIKHYPYRYRHYAREAAEAALSARDQGKYWRMHDIMLEQSPRLERRNLVKYAEEIGLDTDRFVKDLDEKKHDAEIQRDVDLAVRLDLYNTPTYFINGRRVIGNRPYEYLKKIIDEELGRGK